MKLPCGFRICSSAVLLVCVASSTAAQTAGHPRPTQRMLQNQQMNAPWNRDLLMRWSADGTSFSEASLFVRSGGVPSLARDEKGRLIAAFQWFPSDQRESFDKVAVRVSETGGASWTEPVAITVANLPENFQRPFDPTIVTLPGPRYRMYFSCGPRNTPGQHGLSTSIATYSAVSGDGVDYTFEPQPRFAVEGHTVIDCAVTQFKMLWYYAAPIGKPEDGAYSGTSADGVSFTRGANLASTGGMNWTGNLIALSNELRFYGSSNRGIWWSASHDGKQWGSATWTGVRGGDPGIVQAGDKFLLVYVSESVRNDPRPFAPVPAPARIRASQ